MFSSFSHFPASMLYVNPHAVAFSICWATNSVGLFLDSLDKYAFMEFACAGVFTLFGASDLAEDG